MNLFEHLHYLFSVQGLLLVVFGTSLGICVGAIPGLTGAMLIALTLPLTFHMEAPHAFILLVSIYVGAISGGLITATLLRMPGTPASIMTTLDGYPMARDGRPGRAIGLGVTASMVGGVISWCFLVLLAEPLAKYSMHLGPFEFFSLIMMAMVLITTVGDKSLITACFSGALGILCAMPGIEKATGEARFTFGITEMNGGFKLLPVLIGLFAISQVINDIRRIDEKITVIPVKKRRELMFRLHDWKTQAVNLIRSSVIGTWIGILPGIGGNVGSIAAYSAAKKMAKGEEAKKFGSGSETAIVASEAANNATVGGALIPLIALGIPGSVVDAILLGALVIHGLQPGPLLFKGNPEMVHTIMGTMLLANLFMFAFMTLFIKQLAKLSTLPRSFLMPVILVFCMIGSYAIANRMFDVWVMLAFGLLGYAFERFTIPLAPFVIGFVLGPIAEENLNVGLMSSGGSYLPLVTRPIALILCVLSACMLVASIRKHRLRHSSRQHDEC